MLTIGLTGWSDHELIAPDRKRKLEDYASHFPFVEVDTSFYGIPSEKSIQSWLDKTPESFQFIPKANSAMTLHRPWKEDTQNLEEVFGLFKERFSPMIQANRVKAFLFQFPPFFHCSQKNVDYLDQISQFMDTLPIAIEFRHSSWYSKENKKKTLALLRKNRFIHTVVDQPQTPGNSVPSVLEGTNPKLTLYRLHGQNYSGWLNAGDDPDWRANRTLYDYSIEELRTIRENALLLEKDAQEVAVIFNNNSGGHAAKNAKELQKLLKIDFEGLNPQQLDLFN